MCIKRNTFSEVLNLGIVKKSGNTSKSSVATTSGKYWSEIVEMIKTSVGGKERKVLTAPMDAKKTIVFTGSSSTEGQGTTDRTTKGYVELFKTKLGTAKYNIINRGVGGDNTGGMINRFYKDLAPLDPDFVFLAFTLGNEGYVSATDKRALVNQFKNNILRLCHMVKQLGATPIVMTQAPTRAYNAEFYDYSQKLTEELESAGVHMCDWGGVLDAMDGTFKAYESIMADDVHYKDEAHVEIANSIPPTLVEQAAFKQGGFLTSPKGFINTGALVTSNPIVYNPTDITTFTYFMRFRKLTPELIGYVSFNPLQRLLGQTDGRLQYNDGAGVVLDIDGAVNYNDGNWHSLAITYSPIGKELRFYADGVFKRTISSQTVNLSKLTVGGRDTTAATLKNTDIKDVILYRTRLTDNRIKSLDEGTISQTSLEIFSPLHDKIVGRGMNLINLAPTNAALEINTGETALTAVSSQLY
jgi:lysophospholipase L1-like esterase